MDLGEQDCCLCYLSSACDWAWRGWSERVLPEEWELEEEEEEGEVVGNQQEQQKGGFPVVLLGSWGQQEPGQQEAKADPAESWGEIAYEYIAHKTHYYSIIKCICSFK